MTAIFSDQIIQKLCVSQSAKKGKPLSDVSQRVKNEIDRLSDSDRCFLATCIEFDANFVTLAQLYDKKPKTVEKRYLGILKKIKQRI